MCQPRHLSVSNTFYCWGWDFINYLITPVKGKEQVLSSHKKAEETNPPLTLPVEQRTFTSPVPFDFPTSCAPSAKRRLIA